MGVRINLSKTFKTPVTFVVLDAEGKPETFTFTAVFKRCTVAELEALGDAQRFDAIKEVMVGWSMQDIDTKEEIPFTPDALDQLLAIPNVALVVAQTFGETVKAAREKN